jgi:hypothetical protein
VNDEVHTFVVDNQKYPQMIEIHAELKRLLRWMHNAGYETCVARCRGRRKGVSFASP